MDRWWWSAIASLRSPAASACRTWAKAQQVWLELDRWGNVAGTAELTGLDRYDVTNCDELSLTTVAGKAGAGIFVSGTYRRPTHAQWLPTAAELAEQSCGI
jgi:hypothetical protein